MHLIHSSAPPSSQPPDTSKSEEEPGENKDEGGGKEGDGANESEGGETAPQPPSHPAPVHEPMTNIKPYILLCDHQIGLYNRYTWGEKGVAQMRGSEVYSIYLAL